MTELNQQAAIDMEKRRRDYVFLLVFMILSYISISVARKFYPVNDEINLADILIATTTFGWYVFLYRITSNFYSSKVVRICYVGLLAFQLYFNGYVHRDNHTAISSLVVPATISYCANLFGLGLVFFILLKDIFSQKHDLPYALLGASNIYFMIPIIFSYLYCLIAIHDPSLVHADPMVPRTLLFNCFDYGWYVLAGIDPPGEKFGEVILTTSILESISANLFVVFIIGRLMTK